jgi:hypothetical protein
VNGPVSKLKNMSGDFKKKHSITGQTFNSV